MASTRTCPHPAEQRSVLSGTRVRELLVQGEPLPAEFTRPEIAELLREAQARQVADRATAPTPAAASASSAVSTSSAAAPAASPPASPGAQPG
jgi:ATP sulfurylase